MTDDRPLLGRGRATVLTPLLLLASAAPPATPAGGTLASVRPDAALIDKGDLGIATYAMLFVIVALLVDRFLDRRALGRLADAIDRASKADSDRTAAMMVQMATFTSVLGRMERHLDGGE